MYLCFEGMETCLLSMGDRFFLLCRSSHCLETKSHTFLQQEYSLLGALSGDSQSKPWLLPSGLLSPEVSPCLVLDHAAALHLHSASPPSPRASPTGALAVSHFSCLSRSKWDVIKDEKHNSSFSCVGPMEWLSLGPLDVWCRGDERTVPLVLVLGTPELPATGTCCDWDQWEEWAMERPRFSSNGWGEPHIGNCEPKVEVMCKTY